LYFYHVTELTVSLRIIEFTKSTAESYAVLKIRFISITMRRRISLFFFDDKLSGLNGIRATEMIINHRHHGRGAIYMTGKNSHLNEKRAERAGTYK